MDGSWCVRAWAAVVVLTCSWGGCGATSSAATFTPTSPAPTSLPATSSPPPATCRMGFTVMGSYPTVGGYYRHQTCFWCYYFVPSHRKAWLLEVLQGNLTLADGTLYPVFMFMDQNGTSHLFDPEDAEGWGLVQTSMADSLEAHKLEDCCREAAHCCTTAGPDSSIQDEAEEANCPATWDGWTCFAAAPPATTVTFPCPHHAYRSLPECTLTGSKTCWQNGTWARNSRGAETSDYTSCSFHQYHVTAYWWEAAMHATSLLSVLPALLLILYYRQLRVQRFYLHLNLLAALAAKAFFCLLDLLLLRLPEYSAATSPLDENSAGCRVLVVGAKVSTQAVWWWMLAESLYLHRLIVAAFKGGGRTGIYLLIGWVPPVVVCGVWAACRALLEDYQCWLGDDHSHDADLYLITEVPKFVILLINAALLANLTRVLMTKLRGVHSASSSASRRAAKATAFLLPMFGLQFFLPLFVPPPSTPCAAMQAYNFISAALDGLQGLYIAVVYCYMNKEVKHQVLRSVYQVRGHFASSRSQDTAGFHTEPRTDYSLVNSMTSGSAAATFTSTCPTPDTPLTAETALTD